MDRRLALVLALSALFLTLGCKQEEGEVCQVYDGRSDCGEGLFCCGAPMICPGDGVEQSQVRGICQVEGTACRDVERECPAPDASVDAAAADEDAGTPDEDAGPADEDAGPVDEDAGAVAVDAGPPDAGSPDAGTDAGPPDAGTDAGSGVDAG